VLKIAKTAAKEAKVLIARHEVKVATANS